MCVTIWLHINNVIDFLIQNSRPLLEQTDSTNDLMWSELQPNWFNMIKTAKHTHCEFFYNPPWILTKNLNDLFKEVEFIV